jgi:hypothetical protein
MRCKTGVDSFRKKLPKRQRRASCDSTRAVDGRLFMLIPVFLVFFVLRDILLLRIGPPAKLFPRFRIYAAVQLTVVVLASVATNALDTNRILLFSRSPSIVLSVMAFYAALAALCLLVRRTDRHHRAWLLAVIPNPMLALGVTVIARCMVPEWWPKAGIVTPTLLACLWIGIVGLSLKGKNELLDVSELDSSLGVAGLVNSVAFLALPAESFLMGENDWSGFLQFIHAILSAD